MSMKRKIVAFLIGISATALCSCKEKGIDYNDEVSISGSINNHTYVDLGLPDSILWATYNVGATNEAGYGDYFAWGETVPVNDPNKTGYKWFDMKGDSVLSIKKYNQNPSLGLADSLTILEINDDAAAAVWGGSWRMPNDKEFYDLQVGCNWKWVKNYNNTGVAGRLGVSKTNGNTIFFPATGQSFKSKDKTIGEDGCYWSSEVCSNFDANVVELVCSWQRNDLFSTCAFRCEGLSVRAVSNPQSSTSR